MNAPTEIKSSIDQGEGYWAGQLLHSSEVDDIQSLIEAQFFDRIREIAPDLEASFRANGMAAYHLLGDKIDHGNTWVRASRRFTGEGLEVVRGSGLFKALENSFGSAEITAEEEGEQPEIQWRLVRPNRPEDLAPIHADCWYWELNNWSVPRGKRRVKVWTMIGGKAGAAGLNIYPNSHRRDDWPFVRQKLHGLFKPIFDEADIKIPHELPFTPPGTSLVFDYALLHSGALNRGDTCRVSFEFTIYVPEKG